MVTTRIPPLPEADWSDRQREILVATSSTDEPARGNWYQSLVRHPELHRRWLAFGATLLVRGALPDRDRELAVLRTAWRTGAEYYWEPHVGLAREAGITSAEIEAVVAGPKDPSWHGHDRALLAAVDELLEDNVIRDATWQELAERYDDAQLIEVPFLVGHYVMVAFAMRSMGVELEDGQAGFDAR